jgi:haloalkane dehalogenase
MELTKELKELYPFKSNFLEIGKNKYHYVDEGEGNVIVLVHGNPTWSFYYRDIIKELSKTHRVIVPDHMGCGLSDQPEDYEYTLENRVKDLGLLISSLGISKHSMLVHDWGGAIGFGHAVDNISNIDKMIILNTGAFRTKTIPFTISLCKLKYVGPFIVKYLNAFCYPATFMTTEKKLSNSVKRGYLFPYSKPSRRLAISEFVKDIPMDETHRSYQTLLDIELKLPNLKNDKLILWGGKDFCFNDEFYDRWRKEYPSAKHVYYKDAGHYVIEDKKDETLKEIKSFLGC